MKNRKYKIAVLGIGAVGGYYGGKLAAFYQGSNEYEIVFIARGENEQAIKTQGLKVITPEAEFVAHPTLVSSLPEEIGNIDFLMCCMKSYDLESSLEPLRDCITNHTTILPIINGLDNSLRIKNLFPQADVCDGCVYIVSRLTAPGIVTVTGKNTLIHFGSDNCAKENLEHVREIFQSASINVNLAENIEQRIWEKFLFVSPFATVTSYLNLPIHDILLEQKHKELFVNLLEELVMIAQANGISLANDFVEKTLERQYGLPPGTTSSMHADFQKKKKTELQSLTGHVVRLGKELNISTPCYERLFGELLLRSV